MRPGPLALLDRVADRLAARVRSWVAAFGLVLFVVFIVVVPPAQAAAGSFSHRTARRARPRTLVRIRGTQRRGRSLG